MVSLNIKILTPKFKSLVPIYANAYLPFLLNYLGDPSKLYMSKIILMILPPKFSLLALFSSLENGSSADQIA